MKIFCIDTNVFLRFILKDNDSLFLEATLLIEKGSKGEVKLFTPSVIIFEISFVLSSVYKVSRQEIVESLESILSTPYIEVEDNRDLNHALTLYKTHASLSLIDSFLIAKSRSMGAELFTFDKKLKKLS